MKENNIEHLPNELLELVFSEMDTLSRIYIRATCRCFYNIVPTIKKKRTFSLYDKKITYKMKCMNEFVDHVYENVVANENNEISYNMTRKTKTFIVFKRKKNKRNYKYNVFFEDNDLIRMKIYYDGRDRHYKVEKLGQEQFCVPTLLFVMAIKFMKKIYKTRVIDYNFNDSLVPMIAKKMMGRNYKGELVLDVIDQDFVI